MLLYFLLELDFMKYIVYLKKTNFITICVRLLFFLQKKAKPPTWLRKVSFTSFLLSYTLFHYHYLRSDEPMAIFSCLKCSRKKYHTISFYTDDKVYMRKRMQYQCRALCSMFYFIQVKPKQKPVPFVVNPLMTAL